jgi:prepilin-type N-terminal cleavage/methylation domain-containing protein/prepilin-type processing-associated H-X9-DG protein
MGETPILLVRSEDAMSSDRRGFTLIELIVVIAIIVVLMAILFPVFAHAKNKAYQVGCTANLRQLQLAVRQYCTDHDGHFPLQVVPADVPYRWVDAIYPYGNSKAVYACPLNPVTADPDSRPDPAAPLPETSYYYCAYTLGGIEEMTVSNAAATISIMDGWFLEGQGGPQGKNYPMYLSPWATPQETADWVNDIPTQHVGVQELNQMHQHNGGVNLVFVDGHCEWVTRVDASQFTTQASD